MPSKDHADIYNTYYDKLGATVIVSDEEYLALRRLVGLSDDRVLRVCGKQVVRKYG